ncbi:hypothetical protein [Massilia cavernae]|uniref:Glycine zipper domain-containing protein n=1 Tax=Massilia cavernae TaxID=2320864 RepID=A0A418Y4B9_9BURK|nr:hypothetical protein [Massilia cavernae]RJG20474.1 hypothetical protein D3872_08390 [Massilia cavernae]
MSTIVAGHFQLQHDIEVAREALMSAGFPDERISGFFVSAPGQHDMTPLGGDNMMSPGAKETPEGIVEGAATGGAVGIAVGAATSMVTGPLGPIVGGLVGAHVGSLYSFAKMKEAGEREEGAHGGENVTEPRKPGMLIAVALADASEEEAALDVLRRLGAHHLERAEGTIVAGDWVDFDPITHPKLIN